MKQHYPAVPILAFICLMAFCPPLAKAQCTCPNGSTPMTQAYNQSLTTSLEESTFTFPQFDPTVGTLICTNVSALISSVVRIRLENDELFAATYRVRYNRSSTISGPGLNPTLVHTFSKNYGPYDLAASDGVYFSGPDFIITNRDSILKNKLLAQTISGDVTPFLGTGNVSYTYTLSGASSISGGGNYLGGPLTSDYIDFTLTYSYCDNAILASDIHDFTVTHQDDNTARIDWNTENELPDNNYQVQLSRDGRHFKAIASIAAGRKPKMDYHYQYPLESADNGTLYFRVRQLNASRQEKYSVVRSIHLSDAPAARFSIYPNPVTDHIRIQFGTPVSGEYRVELRNSLGKLVDSRQITVNNQSETSYTFNTKPTAGIYFLTGVHTGTGARFGEKIVIR